MNTNNAILITILIIFLALGFVTPFIHESFGASDTLTSDGQNFKDEIGQNDPGSTEITAGSVLFSIGSMFFWTFGSLPLWLDLLLSVLRIILYVIIYDKIRGI